jgi:hypothetical protein
MGTIVQTETRRRGFFGKLWKWGFVAFNIAMAFWLLAYLGAVGDFMETAPTAAHRWAAAIHADFAIRSLFLVWFCGAVVLGVLAWATRGQRVVVETSTTA